jgi:hypothetical protein
MTIETIGQMPDTNESTEGIANPVSIESLRLEREAFTDNLLVNGCITEEFAFSDAKLDRFALDPATGTDAMKHLLIGDSTGGCHHLRTVIDLGVEGRTVASEVYDPGRPERETGRYVREQKVKKNGVFGANIIDIEESGITYRKIGGKEKNGSSMFPNEWSTQEVLQAILEVADMPPKSTSEMGLRSFNLHDAKINGVRIRVVTDKESNKIITASPIHSDR